MSRWPFKGDLPVDRARQVAIRYRDALWNVDREGCTAIDVAASLAGEGWVLGDWAIEEDDDLVTVARAAELVGRSKRWVYIWVAANGGNLGPRAQDGSLLVRLGDVRQAVAHGRMKRAGGTAG